MTTTIHHGDCLDVLRTMPDNSVHAIVTDPPYGLANTTPDQVADTIVKWVSGERDYLPSGRGFMGKSWDAFVPPVAVWDECMRVLKPGGHVLSFAGTRTMDLMTLGLRLAGFDIRDSIGYGSGMVAWVYGTGFPKSHNPGRDKRFCQCKVPHVRESAAEDAAEPGAEVLQPHVCRGGKKDAPDSEDMHGMRRRVQAEGPVSSREGHGVLTGVHEQATLRDHDRATLEAEPEGHCGVCDLREGVSEVPEQGEAGERALLLAELRREGPCGASCSTRLRRDRSEAQAPVRGGEPGMEGWGDVQAGEGKLPRPPLREMPGGMADDGPEGRVHHGAPSSHGPVGRQAATAHGSGEPHQPESEGQPQGEPGTVPIERGSQAGRGRPVCAGCGKPLRPEGLGSALKPAWEPCIIARKPLDGTLAANVLEHGTGAINVDACRIGAAAGDYDHPGNSNHTPSRDIYEGGTGDNGRQRPPHPSGRWPANVILDEHMARVLDQQSGTLTSGKVAPGGFVGEVETSVALGDKRAMINPASVYGDTGGASRFFKVVEQEAPFMYAAKAPKRERPDVDGIKHPTVKPLALMQWLVRLVTPPNGIILDPFAGSGTTIEAAMLEGFDCIGIEREAEYLPLIQHRIDRATEQLATEDPEQGSFSFEETA